MRKVLTLLILVSTALALNAQTGSLTGIISDKETLETIPFASVIIETQKGQQIAGASTSFDGLYLIDSIPIGSYKMRVMFVGYETGSSKIEIFADSAITKHFQLKASAELMEVVMCVAGVQVRSGRGRKKRSITDYSVKKPVYPDETYDQIKANRFLAPTVHPLSTFSIDVDVASYSNVRRYLNQGNMPPVDAVRTEEMINYFTYNYADPLDDHPVAITTEVAACGWNPDHKMALIGIQTQHVDIEDIPPGNLVFLLDVSGSMDSPDKLPLLKNSLRLLVNNLREEDKVSIVVYAGNAGLVLKPTRGDQKQKILDALESLQAGGSTAGGEGILLAYDLAEKNFIEAGNNRVILATDGDFNVGISDDASLVRLIEEKRESGIYLTVLGFGQGNLKDSKMEKLADHGNGNYAYIDNLLEAQKTLVSEMGGTLLTVAKDVKIQVEFNPDKVQAYRLIGYENRLLDDEDFNDDLKDAGDIGAGKSVTALYEIIPVGVNSEFEPVAVDELKYQKRKKSKDAIFSDELMFVKVRYKFPKERKSQLLQQAVKDNSFSVDEASGDLLFASAVAEFSMILRQDEYTPDASFDHVITVSEKAMGADKEGYRAEFVRLVKLAQSLEKDNWQTDLGK